jgi:arylsulfatase
MANNKNKTKQPKSGANGGGNLQDSIQRSVLPIPDIPPNSLTTFDAKDPDTKYPPIRPISPPDGAPNVMVILIDDAGYGSSSAFGGPCQTPNFEKLAKGGLRYTRFHTTRYVRRHARRC